MNKQKALERVAALSRKIAEGELSLDEWKWQRAEAMATAADAGATIREVASAAGLAVDKKGDSNSVRTHIKTFRTYRAESARPAFAEAYASVRGFDWDEENARLDVGRAKRILAEAPIGEVEEIFRELSKERQEELSAMPPLLGAQVRRHEKDQAAQAQREEDLTREHGSDWHRYPSDALSRMAQARRLAREAYDAVAAADRTDQLDMQRTEEATERDLIIASAQMTIDAWQYVKERAEGGDVDAALAELLNTAI